MATPITQKRPPGRPPKADDARKRNILAIRTRDELKQALERRAAANQRSLSEEAEARLEYSLRSEGLLEQALDLAFGPQLAGVLLVLGKVMRDSGSISGFVTTHSLAGATEWLGRSYAFSQATQAADTVFEALRPEDDGIEPPKMGTPFPGGPDFDALAKRRGAGFATTVLAAIAGEEISSELTQLAEQARKRLGPAAVARIKDWVREGRAHNG